MESESNLKNPKSKDEAMMHMAMPLFDIKRLEIITWPIFWHPRFVLSKSLEMS